MSSTPQRSITLDVVGQGPRTIEISWVLNGGYAGRDTAQVQHHVDELAELGVPAPTSIPTLYPLSNLLVRQESSVQVPHARTSGEAEWAIVIGSGRDDILITAACDHTDRALEVHGVAWSKQSAPDFLGDTAWRLSDVADDLDSFTLRAWVTNDGTDELIQDGSPAQLLPPSYWVDELDKKGLLRPGTVVMSGTIPMVAGVDQFADAWRVELADAAGNVSKVAYTVEQLPTPWE